MKIKFLLIAGCVVAGLLAANLVFAQTTAVSATTDQPVNDKIQFEDPVRLEVAGEPVNVEAPGFSCPSWADMDGDGLKDLLVGQFAGGKIKVYRNLGDKGFAEGEWLEADGEPAEVPGVW